MRVGIAASSTLAEAQLVEIKRQNAMIDIIEAIHDNDGKVNDKLAVFDVLVAWNVEITTLSAQLHALSPYLKPNGELQLWIKVNEDTERSVSMAFLIGGFVDSKQISKKQALSVDGILPNMQLEMQCISCKKASFQEGESVKLPNAKISNERQPNMRLKWKLIADEDEELVDEDSLLDDTAKVIEAAREDCGVSADTKRRACKNCTCGRKDAEEGEPIVSDQELAKMVSSCGNCYKGDAFRCGSCPFLGKPAFQAGTDKVLLNLQNDL